MTDAQKALDEYPLLKNGEIAGSMACWTYLHRNGETIRTALQNADKDNQKLFDAGYEYALSIDNTDPRNKTQGLVKALGRIQKMKNYPSVQQIVDEVLAAWKGE